MLDRAAILTSDRRYNCAIVTIVIYFEREGRSSADHDNFGLRFLFSLRGVEGRGGGICLCHRPFSRHLTCTTWASIIIISVVLH